MTIASCALFFKIFKSSSIPTTNIKRTRPIWLSTPKLPNELTGKRNEDMLKNKYSSTFFYLIILIVGISLGYFIIHQGTRFDNETYSNADVPMHSAWSHFLDHLHENLSYPLAISPITDG